MTEYLAPLVHIVEPKDDGVMLKVILRDRMKLSRTLLAKLKMSEQGIMLNGVRVYTSASVRSGDRIEVRMKRETSDDILPEPMPLHILHEDEHLLVVNKPAGLIVHPTHGHYTGTLANGVVHHWLVKGETVRFRPIHRLDQDTSGVLAIAKNPFVHQQVSEQMKKKRVAKTYIAFVHGKVVPAQGVIDAPIDRSAENPHIRTVRPDGYPSVTRYELITDYGVASLVRIWLETGRTHQIRVHMKHIGHPLLGDALYGPDIPEGEGADHAYADPDYATLAVHRAIARQALHAESLSFEHPITGLYLTFTAPWPDDLRQLCNQLEQQHVERM